MTCVAERCTVTHMEATTAPGTILTLDVNNAGHPFIGACDFDAEGMGTRAYVISHGGEFHHPRIMRKTFDDLLRLMGDNVESEVTPLFEAVEAIAPSPLTKANGSDAFYVEAKALHAERRATEDWSEA